MMNKQKGNMYAFVTHTWNAVKGKCPHECPYCYMRNFSQKELRFDESELKTDLGESNFIFVGSSCDVWAWTVPDEWIEKVLEHCKKYPKNKYLFQSKNPARFRKFYGKYPPHFILGTTIETNYNLEYPGCPEPSERMTAMVELAQDGATTTVTIEPIMSFDLAMMLEWFEEMQPAYVSIGADSKGHKLDEPMKEQIETLIAALKDITDVRLKKNLNRLLK